MIKTTIQELEDKRCSLEQLTEKSQVYMAPAGVELLSSYCLYRVSVSENQRGEGGVNVRGDQSKGASSPPRAGRVI